MCPKALIQAQHICSCSTAEDDLKPSWEERLLKQCQDSQGTHTRNIILGSTCCPQGRIYNVRAPQAWHIQSGSRLTELPMWPPIVGPPALEFPVQTEWFHVFLHFKTTTGSQFQRFFCLWYQFISLLSVDDICKCSVRKVQEPRPAILFCLNVRTVRCEG